MTAAVTAVSGRLGSEIVHALPQPVAGQPIVGLEPDVESADVARALSRLEPPT